MGDPPRPQPISDLPCLRRRLGPQAVIDGQRNQVALPPARPLVGEQAKGDAVGAARHANGDFRPRLERPDARHERIERRGCERPGFGHAAGVA